MNDIVYYNQNLSIYSDQERALFNRHRPPKEKEYFWSVACLMGNGRTHSLVLITTWAKTEDEARGYAVSEAMKEKPHMGVSDVLSTCTNERTL